MEIALVVSDVDGTLVTRDKRLTPATIAAVKDLGEAGIAFTIASARPPIGLKALVEPLGLRLPMGVYNGGGLVEPDLTPIRQSVLAPAAARETVDRLDAAGIDVWVFARGRWHLRDPRAPYTDLERRTLGVEPDVEPDLRPFLDAAAKIVGVSRDPERLEAMETELAEGLGGEASLHRSQTYYLDVTPPGVTKASVVEEVAGRLGISRQRIATLGDAANDLPMFRASGVSIAMGNAAPDVKRAASRISASNDEDGFAKAIAGLLAQA